MVLEIWILERDIEQLKKLEKSWFHLKDAGNQAIRYLNAKPRLSGEWICVHIGLDEYTNLKDHGLLFKP